MNTSMQNMLNEIEALRLLLSKYNNLSELPNIERDIIKSKLQLVYNNLILENIAPIFNEDVVQPVEEKPLKTKKAEVSRPKGVVSEKENKLAADVHAEIPVENANDNILTIEDEQLQNKENEAIKEAVLESFSQKPPIETENQTDKTIVAEKYHKNQTYINEMLAQGLQKKDVSSLMQGKAVKDIEAAIGINEKFIFIKELFSGDGETYLKTIRILNNAANFNEAFNYIRQTYSWNLDGEAVQKLLDIVRRRFIVDVE